jgi:hypothetical protein
MRVCLSILSATANKNGTGRGEREFFVVFGRTTMITFVAIEKIHIF